MRYFQTFSWRNSCLILDSQTINQFILSRTKCHSPCLKVVKKSGRYLFLFENNKEFKIGSYFSITLYFKYFFIKFLLKVPSYFTYQKNDHEQVVITYGNGHLILNYIISRKRGSMIMDNRIFSRKFVVYGRLGWDTARKRTVFRRNPCHLNTALCIEWLGVDEQRKPKKFQSHWIGPYKIRKLCPLGTYQLERVKGQVKLDLVHRDMVKQAHVKSTPTQQWFKPSRRINK